MESPVGMLPSLGHEDVREALARPMLTLEMGIWR
jgi:hypothetical protein